tara:strand:+ start:11897 stop:12118 length:222 start_codon:yes stop_codon:yes gene_type:complete
MAIELVPAAKKWHKRWTTWLLALAGMLSSLQAFMPGIQQYMSPTTYGVIMIALTVITWAAAQVKQKGISGEQP